MIYPDLIKVKSKTGESSWEYWKDLAHQLHDDVSSIIYAKVSIKD